MTTNQTTKPTHNHAASDAIGIALSLLRAAHRSIAIGTERERALSLLIATVATNLDRAWRAVDEHRDGAIGDVALCLSALRLIAFSDTGAPNEEPASDAYAVLAQAQTHLCTALEGLHPTASESTTRSAVLS